MSGRIGRTMERLAAAALLAAGLAACDSVSAGPDDGALDSPCTVDAVAPVAYTRPAGAGTLSRGALGLGAVTDRYTSELAVGARYAYTGTWGRRGALRGDVLHVWDLAGAAPALVRSLRVGPDSVSTLGDVQISDDGRYLAVATEQAPWGSLRLYDLADPASPRLLSVFQPPSVANGVHTAQLSRVDGKLYGFLSIDPAPSRLVVVDLSDPARPVEVLSRQMGNPFVHDVFVRDGILFTALWNGGLTIWDVGGCGRGTPANPVEIGNVRTEGGQTHNVWWYHAPNGSRRYAFVGQEGPGVIGATSSGDVHVVDVSDLSKPREVAFYSVPDAGTHNFSMDESRGILYAAYYDGGVRALDVRGDLAACTDAQRAPDGRCDLGRMGREIARWLVDADPAAYVWGVEWRDGALFASDMLNGLHRLDLSGVAP